MGASQTQAATQSLAALSTELQDGLGALIAMAQQADQRATDATKRLELMRSAMGGDTTLEGRPTTASIAHTQSVWDFSPVAAAIIQALLLAITTLVPLTIAWAAWEIRKRTGVLAKRNDAIVLGNAVRNSVGAMQEQALRTGGALDNTVGISYVLTHAGKEAERLGVGVSEIYGKISAQVGLREMLVPATPAAKPAA